MPTDLILDALRMALHRRALGADVALVHHGDRGSQCKSFLDSFKTELTSDRVWRSRSQLELAVVGYLAWYNGARQHESLGDLLPIEYEQKHPTSRPTTLAAAMV